VQLLLLLVQRRGIGIGNWEHIVGQKPEAGGLRPPVEFGPPPASGGTVKIEPLKKHKRA